MSARSHAGRPVVALAAGGGWVVFALLMTWQSFDLVELEEATASGVFGPAFYPRLVAGLIAVFGAVACVQAWRGQPTIPAESVAPPSPDPPSPDPASPMATATSATGGAGRVVGAFAWLLGYTLVLEWAGYLLATPVMLIGLMFLMGERRVGRLVLWSAGLTGGLFVIFRYGVTVILPEGSLW